MRRYGCCCPVLEQGAELGMAWLPLQRLAEVGLGAEAAAALLGELVLPIESCQEHWLVALRLPPPHQLLPATAAPADCPGTAIRGVYAKEGKKHMR